MKKVVGFLLAFLIFVTPVTTLVKADVVIGDNDETILNENATILGRKLAMLESLSDLALSGVTEFTISNTDDVDSYLESLWSEINDAIDYLDSGDWVGDIPNNIASKYYTNLVKYRDIVNNRGEFLGFDLQNPTTSLLKTYFANDTYGKKYTSSNLYSTLDMVRALSNLSRNQEGPTPSLPDNYSWLSRINQLYIYHSPFLNTDFYRYNQNYIVTWTYPLNQFTFHNGVTNKNLINYRDSNNYTSLPDLNVIGYTTIYLNNNGNGYSATFSPLTNRIYKLDELSNNSTFDNYSYGFCAYYRNSQYEVGWSNNRTTLQTTQNYSSLDLALNDIYANYFNVDIYVDNVLWVKGQNDLSVTSPILDIDGFLKIYGNDNPTQYELQPNTQIDYDQLYQVIYNAIRDNLPISQGDINYYDSHDTIYSPTIINNYGEEEGDESDLIDTILDYAVIPKFDTAIAQPMRQALTNGVVIMQNSITNVIPNEILLILGACFFLLLFAVVINRMIK